MKKITSWVFLLALVIAVPVLAQPTLTANPNPLPAGTTTVTISWNAPGHALVYVYVGSATGTLFASGGPTGSSSWPYAAPGQVFYLVDPNTSDTLASLTLTSVATITLTPNPLPAGVTALTVSWSAPGYSAVDIHTGSATGPVFTSGGSSGSAADSGASVVPGLSFYLVDHATGTFLASASVLGDWDIPTANQSACLPFAVLSQAATAGPAGYVTCWRVGYLHWYTIGADWSTGFTLTNPTSSDIAISITVENQAGLPYTPSSAQLNGAPLTLDANSSATGILPKHGTLRFNFPNPGSSSAAAGQILVQAEAKDGLSLNTIQAVEDYTYTSPADVVYATVTVPVSWVDLAVNAYSSTFEETTADGSQGSFAVKNMSGSAQTLDVKVFDVNGNQLGDQQVPLAANQTWANTSDGLFGASTFSSLPLVPIVRLQFTGTAPIAVLVLQKRGLTFASIPAQPTFEQ